MNLLLSAASISLTEKMITCSPVTQIVFMIQDSTCQYDSIWLWTIPMRIWVVHSPLLHVPYRWEVCRLICTEIKSSLFAQKCMGFQFPPASNSTDTFQNWPDPPSSQGNGGPSNPTIHTTAQHQGLTTVPHRDFWFKPQPALFSQGGHRYKSCQLTFVLNFRRCSSFRIKVTQHFLEFRWPRCHSSGKPMRNTHNSWNTGRYAPYYPLETQQGTTSMTKAAFSETFLNLWYKFEWFILLKRTRLRNHPLCICLSRSTCF